MFLLLISLFHYCHTLTRISHVSLEFTFSKCHISSTSFFATDIYSQLMRDVHHMHHVRYHEHFCGACIRSTASVVLCLDVRWVPSIIVCGISSRNITLLMRSSSPVQYMAGRRRCAPEAFRYVFVMLPSQHAPFCALCYYWWYFRSFYIIDSKPFSVHYLLHDVSMCPASPCCQDVAHTVGSQYIRTF